MPGEARKRFPTTSWTLVRSAAGTESETARLAVSRLCEAYWFPLYSYARRLGHSEQDAKDLVQGFFASLLGRRRLLAGVKGESSLFRTYLKRGFDYYASDERDKAGAEKRGGGVRDLPLEIDLPDGERRFVVEPLAELTPDRAYDRLWALATLDRALARLRASYDERRAVSQFEALLPCLEGDPADRPYDEIAASLGVSVNAARVTASRFRRRYGQCLLEELSDIASDPEDVKRELSYLQAALAAPDS
jgi:RNA polymerase sigma-70 factor (ECF subfamily)